MLPTKSFSPSLFLVVQLCWCACTSLVSILCFVFAFHGSHEVFGYVHVATGAAGASPWESSLPQRVLEFICHCIAGCQSVPGAYTSAVLCIFLAILSFIAMHIIGLSCVGAVARPALVGLACRAAALGQAALTRLFGGRVMQTWVRPQDPPRGRLQTSGAVRLGAWSGC